MVEATVRVYVEQPFKRNLRGEPIKAGWWWYVRVGRESPSDAASAWAPDRVSAWDAALARLAELKEGSYA